MYMMKKLVYLFAMAAISVFAANCSSSRSAATATSGSEMSSSDKVAEIKKNFSDDQLAEGRTIFESKCNKCHGLKDPATRTVEKLEKVLPSMFRKSNLSDEQGALVRAYLLSKAKLS